MLQLIAAHPRLLLTAVLFAVLFFWERAYMIFVVPWFTIPKDEFAPMLELDVPLMLRLPFWLRPLYEKNLYWRRQISHERSQVGL